MSLVSTLLHFLSLPFKNPMLEAVVMLLIGMSLIPISSVSLSFSVELAFPVPEAVTNGMMITVSLLWGTGVGLFCSYLTTINPTYVLSLWSGCAALSIIVSFFIREELRRLQLDDVKNSEYIYDEVIRRQSFEQREVFMRENGLEGDPRFHFEFDN